MRSRSLTWFGSKVLASMMSRKKISGEKDFSTLLVMVYSRFRQNVSPYAANFVNKRSMGLIKK